RLDVHLRYVRRRRGSSATSVAMAAAHCQSHRISRGPSAGQGARPGLSLSMALRASAVYRARLALSALARLAILVGGGPAIGLVRRTSICGAGGRVCPWG